MSKSSQVTAFPAPAQTLASQLREAALDHAAFESPLRLCELSRCRATCCHDGAVLSAEEASTIQELLASHPAAFTESSALSQAPAIVERDRAFRTAVRTAPRSELAEDFPSHFSPTRCVFLDARHRCTLQLFSQATGHHPWFYKPISCWMHPLILRRRESPEDRPTLTLLGPEADPGRFATCTPCGRPDESGAPAREILAPELAALSQLAGRDFLAELNAPPAS